MSNDKDFEAWMWKHRSKPIHAIAYDLWRDNRELLAKVIKLEEDAGNLRGQLSVYYRRPPL